MMPAPEEQAERPLWNIRLGITTVSRQPTSHRVFPYQLHEPLPFCGGYSAAPAWVRVRPAHRHSECCLRTGSAPARLPRFHNAIYPPTP